MATKAKNDATANAADEVNPNGDELPPPNLIPGSDIIGRGIYIRPRQPYELKPSLLKPSSNGGIFQSYTRPTTDKTYIIPAGCSVNSSPPLPADQSFGQTLIEESWSRFSKQFTVSASASASGKSVSIDANAFQANSVKSSEDSYYALRGSFVPLWDLYIPSIPNALLKEVEDLENLVPKDWQGEYDFDWGNREEYAKIFDHYGTHFVKNVWVGGKASLVFTIAKSSNLKTSEIRAAIQGSLGPVAKVSVSGERTTSQEAFSSNSSCTVFGSGGDGVLLAKLSEFDKANYNSWLESVEKYPAVIQLGVAGIWTLLKDKNKAEALKEAYIQETSFVPLTAIIPIGGYYIFLKDSWGFAIDYLKSPYASKPKTLERVDYELKLRAGLPDLKEPDPRLKLENIVKYFPFLKDCRYSDFSRPQAGLSLSAVKDGCNPEKNRVYLFKHKRCLLVDFNIISLADVRPVDGYPKYIAEEFPGIDLDRVDAALALPPNKLYLFSGPDYYRIEVSDSGTYTVVAKEKIINGWPGVDFERLDTATYWKNSKIYFFYEDQYIRYDVSNHRTDPGYPKQIPSNYVEDWDFFD